MLAIASARLSLPNTKLFKPRTRTVTNCTPVPRKISHETQRCLTDFCRHATCRFLYPARLNRVVNCPRTSVGKHRARHQRESKNNLPEDQQSPNPERHFPTGPVPPGTGGVSSSLPCGNCCTKGCSSSPFRRKVTLSLSSCVVTFLFYAKIRLSVVLLRHLLCVTKTSTRDHD